MCLYGTSAPLLSALASRHVTPGDASRYEWYAHAFSLHSIHPLLPHSPHQTLQPKGSIRSTHSGLAAALLLTLPVAVHGQGVVCDGEGLAIESGLWGVSGTSLQNRAPLADGT